MKGDHTTISIDTNDGKDISHINIINGTTDVHQLLHSEKYTHDNYGNKVSITEDSGRRTTQSIREYNMINSTHQGENFTDHCVQSSPEHLEIDNEMK